LFSLIEKIGATSAPMLPTGRKLGRGTQNRQIKNLSGLKNLEPNIPFSSMDEKWPNEKKLCDA